MTQQNLFSVKNSALVLLAKSFPRNKLVTSVICSLEVDVLHLSDHRRS